MFSKICSPLSSTFTIFPSNVFSSKDDRKEWSLSETIYIAFKRTKLIKTDIKTVGKQPMLSLSENYFPATPFTLLWIWRLQISKPWKDRRLSEQDIVQFWCGSCLFLTENINIQLAPWSRNWHPHPLSVIAQQYVTISMGRETNVTTQPCIIMENMTPIQNVANPKERANKLLS